MPCTRSLLKSVQELAEEFRFSRHILTIMRHLCVYGRVELRLHNCLLSIKMVETEIVLKSNWCYHSIRTGVKGEGDSLESISSPSLNPHIQVLPLPSLPYQSGISST